MAYNRWLTPNNPYDYGSSELYHHGVKGMKRKNKKKGGKKQ